MSEDEFMFSVLSKYLTVSAVAVSTGWGATGKWIFGRFCVNQGKIICHDATLRLFLVLILCISDSSSVLFV